MIAVRTRLLWGCSSAIMPRLAEDFSPVVHRHQRIPIALKENFKAELDLLKTEVIISPVTEPTPWVNSFVCETNAVGSVRRGLDPQDLNKAELRPHYVTPVIAQLHGTRWFSMVDIKSGC